MILTFFFTIGVLLWSPILQGVSFALQCSIALIISFSFFDSPAAFFVVPPLSNCMIFFLSAMVSLMPLMIVQSAYTHIVESLEMSRGVSLGGVMNPYSQTFESPSSVAVVWLCHYDFFCNHNGFEKIFLQLLPSFDRRDTFLEYGYVLKDFANSVIIHYQYFFFFWISVFSSLLFIELSIAYLSRILQGVLLADLSFLMKMALVFIVMRRVIV